MVSTHLGKLSKGRVNTFRTAIGEEMVGQLVETEILFYTLIDAIGVGPQTASLLALSCYNGGAKVNAKRISDITKDIEGKSYELSTRRVHQFMKLYMKSSRIELIDKQPQIWQMNGFSTFEPPFISGYERDTIESLTNARNELKRKYDLINSALQLRIGDI